MKGVLHFLHFRCLVSIEQQIFNAATALKYDPADRHTTTYRNITYYHKKTI